MYRRDQPNVQLGRFREFYQCDFDIAGNYGKAHRLPTATAPDVSLSRASEKNCMQKMHMFLLRLWRCWCLSWLSANSSTRPNEGVRVHALRFKWKEGGTAVWCSRPGFASVTDERSEFETCAPVPKRKAAWHKTQKKGARFDAMRKKRYTHS